MYCDCFIKCNRFEKIFGTHHHVPALVSCYLVSTYLIQFFCCMSFYGDSCPFLSIEILWRGTGYDPILMIFGLQTPKIHNFAYNNCFIRKKPQLEFEFSEVLSLTFQFLKHKQYNSA